MNFNINFAVVRSHALIADLLKPEKIIELAKSGSVNGFVENLLTTPYGKISLEDIKDTSIALERGFYAKFIERMTKIVEISPRKMGEFLQAYYYLRFESLNLKRILRGKFSEQPVKNIVDLLVPMAPYKLRDYGELAEAEDLDATVKLLKETPYSSIESSLELCKQYDALWPLEQALNKIYAEAVLKSLETLSREDRTVVQRILKFEVNVENLLNAIKYRRTRKGDQDVHELEELFPIIFDVEINQIKVLIEAEDLMATIKNLDEPYDEILSPIYEGNVALIRARVRRHIHKIVKDRRASNTVGFNVILAYLVLSELEKDDLVGIAWGLSQGITADDMTKYLASSPE